MSYFKLKTHTMGRRYEEPHFFMLNKGNNAGKPLKEACPNCFVVCTSELNHLNKLYWLTYSLWKTKRYEVLLKGSVIPFLTIDEAKKLLLHSSKNLEVSRVEKVVEALRQVEALERQQRAKEKLFQELKTSLLRELVN
jgi:hypothetical protein